jgi:hypothetical protein
MFDVARNIPCKERCRGVKLKMESEENYGDCGRPVDWPVFPKEPRGLPELEMPRSSTIAR